MEIHWFPGHMKKALKEIEDKIRIVDVVIEVFDVRIPLSSVNEEFENVIKNKKKLLIYTKKDLADDVQTLKWVNHFKEKGVNFICDDIVHVDICKQISHKIAELGKEKHKKEIARGMKPQPLKVMIIGIPNVGKSSLINKLARRRAAGVQNKPGYTRGEQYIKVNNDFLLVDTPGILPMSYDDKKKAANLALIGSIREDILPNYDLITILLNFFIDKYPNALEARFGIKEINGIDETIELVGRKRGLLTSNSQVDVDKTIALILKEFKDGTLGKFTLEWLE
jgi:ribosome biogenesis GTPase A